MTVDPNRPSPGPEIRIGSYRLVESLGSGGMSTVFRAIHDGSGHEVAVKVLPRTLARSSATLQRFLREARNAEALEHPNIVAIYDRGSDGGRYYIVLEYVDGGDLHEAVRNGGPLAPAEVLEITRGVAEGLRYAAGRGVIHRDIKPANLLRTSDGRVKVADLGLALQVEADDERVTRDGTTVGTVDYMAPEQARDSRAASIRSDIYSLGCTLHFLLTGSPPYPGGDVAEKLSKHCNDPPSDPRRLRPSLPEGLARLVTRMTAKRPEDRFADYDELLRSVEGVRLDGPAGVEATEYALIDDEDDPPGDDDGGWLPLGVPPQGSTREASAVAPRWAAEDPSGSLGAPASLAELASLDLDDEPEVPARPGGRGAAAAEGPVLRRGAFEEDAEPAAVPVATQVRPRGDELSTEAWVAIGLASGVAVVLVMVALRFALSTSEIEEDLPIEVAAAPAPAEVFAPVIAPPRPPEPPPPEPPPLPPPDWVEPAEDEPSLPDEDRLPPGLESRLVPAWALADEPEPIGGPRLVVSRLPEAGAESRVPSLKRAFDAALEGTLELADVGPFFEDDLRVTGRARAVEASPGLRALIRVLGRADDALRPSPAACVLEGKRLIIRNLDLVVDASEFRAQNSLFLCRGADLELWDCTITILNGNGRPFAAIQVGDAKGTSRPSRVRLERTLIRGADVPAIAWEDEAGEVVVSRSVLLSGPAPAVSIREARPGNGRRLVVSRSILAGAGPAIEVGSSRALDSFEIAALGSTFARRAGAGADCMLTLVDDTGPEPDLSGLWSGDGNAFVGWGSLAARGRSKAVLLTDLEDAREAWAGSEASSRWTSDPWPRPVVDEHPGGLRALAPERAATLARVASPTPLWRAKAVESFERLPVPPLVSRLPARAAAPQGGGGAVAMRALDSIQDRAPEVGSNVGRAGGQGGVEASDQQVLEFDAQAAPHFGDLGRFLRDNVRPEARRVRVVARGVGPKATTPVRLSDGVGLELEVAQPSAPGLEPLAWTPRPDAPAEPALIQVVEADLVLVNVQLGRGADDRLGHLVRVVDGNLVMLGCRLRAPGSVPEGAGGLLAFETTGTRPLAPRPGPFAPTPDRPTALLIDTLLMTGGVALSAEVGRGVVWLSNCAVVAGEAAFDLRPLTVRRDRFEADLQLDRCTVAAEGDVVRIGRWPGAGPGPDRPWLISTRSSAFLDAYDRPARRGVMVRSEADGLPRGALIWQADGDAYEFAHFVAPAEDVPASNPRVDVRRHWIELWGRNRVRGVSGPIAGRGSPTLLLLADRLTPGRVSPGDLFLHPRSEVDAQGRPIGADLRRLGIEPTPPQAQPPGRPGRRR